MQPSRRDEFELPSLDFLAAFTADTEQVRAQALAKLPASGEKPVLRERYEGKDPSEAVAVAVNDKCFVIDVDVARDWKERVSAEEFASAVHQAYSMAIAAQLEDVALGELWEDEQRRARQKQREFEERIAAQRGDVLPPDPDAQVVDDDPPPEDPRDWMAWVQDSIYRLGDEMYRIERLERAMGSGEDKAVWGQHGYLKVVHRGQDIDSITGDAARIRTAESYQLRSEALEVLRTAQHDKD